MSNLMIYTIVIAVSLFFHGTSYSQVDSQNTAIQNQTNKCSRIIRIAPEDWIPYSLIVEKDAVGIDIDSIKEVMKEAGCEIEILTKIPRKRRLELFKRGQIDILYAASKNAEREQFSYFTRPYRKESIALFHLESNRDAASVTSFEEITQRGYHIIAPNAGFYGKDYEDASKVLNASKRILHYEEVTQGIKMLAAKRAQILLGDYYSVLYYASKMNIKLNALSYFPNEDLIYFMLSKASLKQSDVDIINKAIQKLEQNGSFKKIDQNYR